MSRILCDNLLNSEEDTNIIQPLAFMKDNQNNPLTSCNDRDAIPVLDFSVFKQEGSDESALEDLFDDY